MAFKTISNARLTPMQNPAVLAKTTFTATSSQGGGVHAAL
jgi:hypothetical protein